MVPWLMATPAAARRTKAVFILADRSLEEIGA
jgi:hypothetical protein